MPRSRARQLLDEARALAHRQGALLFELRAALDSVRLEPAATAVKVLARVTEEGLGDLDDAWRIATAESPVPYSPPLEDAFLPNAERIAGEIRTRTL